MAIDVVDLRQFYNQPLGRVAQRFIGRIVRQRWHNCAGLSVLGLGFATPYLGVYRDEAVRVLAFMPAEQGVVNWPDEGVSSSALVDVGQLPLPDSSMDRILVVHALEVSDQPHTLLSEVWRVLVPNGRALFVIPNRAGMWARFESTPFGEGLPFSRGQLRKLMRETLFTPLFEKEALYVPPFERQFLLQAAPAFERLGGRLALPGGGVHIVEATKQLYRPVGTKRLIERAVPRLNPALPAAGYDHILEKRSHINTLKL
jgi:SAM-dependent methyltransferase